MAQAEDAGTEHHGHFDVQPGLHDLATHAQQLHQAPGHDAAHQHFPGGFHPQVDHPPPPVLVHGDVGDVEHAGEVEAGQRHQVQGQHAGDARPAAFAESAGDVVEEYQHHNDDPDVGPARRFDVLAAFVDEPDGGVVAGARLHQQVDQHHHRHRRRQHPEGDAAQLQTDHGNAAFFFQQPVNGADETVQQPYHHGVDVHHAVDVEIQHAEQEVRFDELDARQQAEEDLRGEQDQRYGEVVQRQLLAAVEGGGIDCSVSHAYCSAVMVLKLWGKPLVSMEDIHLRKAMTPRASASVKCWLGMRRVLP